MIRLEQIERRFHVGEGLVQALQDINLQINDGEYLSLMGPSGSGKSTLLNLLGLLDHADSGRYLFNQIDTSQLNDDARTRLRLHKIGFVFQSFHLIARLSAAENIELPMMLAGINESSRRQKVQQLLEQFNLHDRAEHLPEQLSGGQRQRVAIARAVVMQPSLLLADEPTGNLDQHAGREVIEALESLNQQGMTLIVVTHDPAIGQRAGVQLKMSDGRIVSRLGHSDETD